MSAPALQTNSRSPSRKLHTATRAIADPAKRRGCEASYYILQLPSVYPSCFASSERETASSLLLFPRYSGAMFVVSRQTHPDDNGPVARLFAVLFLQGHPRVL